MEGQLRCLGRVTPGQEVVDPGDLVSRDAAEAKARQKDTDVR